MGDRGGNSTQRETIKVHGVDELLADIGRLHPQPDPSLARANELNAHNAGARYPGVRGATAPASSYKHRHAEDAIKIAEALFAFCDPLCARLDEFWDGLK